MDKKLKAAIQRHYKEEYFQAILDKKTGRLGTMARWATRPLSNRSKVAVGALVTVEAGAIVGAGIAGGFIPALIALGAINVIGVPVNGPLGISIIKAQRAAAKAVNKDIENGTLVTRYQTEVLDKKAALTQAPIVKPQETVRTFFKKTLKPGFAAASKNTLKTSAHKHWHSLQHHLKL